METIEKELFYLLKVFCAVVEENSFTAAANKLNVQGPAVSKAIARLESQLGKRLLNRSTRVLELTNVGHLLFQRAQQQLINLDNTLAQVAAFESKPEGVLKLTATPSIGNYLAEYHLMAFYEKFPEIHLDIKLSNDVIQLPSQHLDLALRSSNQLEDSQLTSRPLFKAQRVLVASPSYIKAFGCPVLPTELNKHQCLVFKHDKTLNQWPYEQQEIKHQLSLNTTLQSNDYAIIKSLCRQGMGIARLFDYQVIDEVKAKSLIPILDNYDWGSQTIHAVYHGKMKDSPKLEVFLSFLATTINEQ
ncbi:LysR family transcriptional regulator [Thalassotalea marina]|uniref:LysR family transcriptional regulator n=1 Tax=Thalassotalea marina TaxID=1673741 RepID=A0A919ENN8_9GAMM|nr:LysR family transcriptional regulator [Thalassotalea marina]GHG00244.1 LysR family transcriptional regulator [Thalassotalea marina]